MGAVQPLSQDLELIFSRFGKVVECEIIRDPITGDSLNYSFITFEEVQSCEEAYKKMDGVLIDDRRIKVDFSQSVAKLWNKYAERPTNAGRKMGVMISRRLEAPVVKNSDEWISREKDPARTGSRLNQNSTDQGDARCDSDGRLEDGRVRAQVRPHL